MELSSQPQALQTQPQPSPQSVLPVLQQVGNVRGCDGCPLQKLNPYNTFVAPKHGAGNRLVVAEAPGETESIEGEPLVGSSGTWFDAMCRKAGVKREDLTIINTINCRPPSNIYPTSGDARSYISEADGRNAVQHCMGAHVWPLIHSQPWSRIDALGDKALQELTGKEGIQYWRGSPLTLKGDDPSKTRVIPTLHPSYISRDQTMIPIVVNDLKKNTQVPPEHYNLTPSLEDVRAFEATDLAFDIETNPATQQILMVGLAVTPFRAMVVPFSGPYIPELKRIFKNAKTLYGQNSIQFDIPILADNGICTNGNMWDIMLLHHLLFPQFSGEAGNEDQDSERKHGGGHGLEFISSQFTNKPAWKEQYRGQPGYWEHRCARDTDVTLQAGRVLVAMARQEHLVDLYDNVQVPLAKICRLMTTTGIKLDPNRLAIVREELLKQIADEEAKLPEQVRGYDKPKRKKVPAPDGTLNEKGKPVKFTWEPTFERKSPWRSPKTLQKFLYTDWGLGLPPQRHPKSKKITTDKGAIEKCIRILRRANRTQDAQGLVGYGKLKKAATLVSSFCTEDLIQQRVKRQHPRFNPHGTSSGRLSSSDPNFQNQPPKARFMYVASHPGWKIVEFDYSNIEPRLTAYFSGDQERLARFSQPGYNEHKWVTSIFFDIPYDEVDSSDSSIEAPYGKAKRINNGLNYRMGPIKIANTFDLDLKEVKDLVFKWKTINHKTVLWQDEVGADAKENGFLTTPFGRKRWFYTSSYLTESASFLPQSSGADIIFKAMLGLMYERINWPVEKVLKVVPIVEPLPHPARLLVQCHDSLVFECPGEMVDQFITTVRRVMEQPIRELGGMSFPVKAKVGESWGEVQAYEALPLAA